LTALTADFEKRREEVEREHSALVSSLQARLDTLSDDGQERDTKMTTLIEKIQELTAEVSVARGSLSESTGKVRDMELEKHRSEYEWCAEREELQRQRHDATQRVEALEQAIVDAGSRESELNLRVADQNGKLEQMKRIMDEQEHELSLKIERVQQYVKERQTGALHAEKKQQDAERMADRWQAEVRRLQSEKDRLTALVLDLENSQTRKAKDTNSLLEKCQQEVSSLKEALQKKEEEMRAANSELLQRRDEEYQAKVAVERQREKDRSVGLMKKKEQEVQIKDQQLKAARRQIEDLEASLAAASGADAQRGGTARRRPAGGSIGNSGTGSGGSGGSGGREGSLPPLPLSAR